MALSKEEQKEFWVDYHSLISFADVVQYPAQFISGGTLAGAVGAVVMSKLDFNPIVSISIALVTAVSVAFLIEYGLAKVSPTLFNQVAKNHHRNNLERFLMFFMVVLFLIFASSTSIGSYVASPDLVAEGSKGADPSKSYDKNISELTTATTKLINGANDDKKEQSANRKKLRKEKVAYWDKLIKEEKGDSERKARAFFSKNKDKISSGNWYDKQYAKIKKGKVSILERNKMESLDSFDNETNQLSSKNEFSSSLESFTTIISKTQEQKEIDGDRFQKSVEKYGNMLAIFAILCTVITVSCVILKVLIKVNAGQYYGLPVIDGVIDNLAQDDDLQEDISITETVTVNGKKYTRKQLTNQINTLKNRIKKYNGTAATALKEGDEDKYERYIGLANDNNGKLEKFERARKQFS